MWGGPVVGISLAAGDGREVEQHAHVVFGSPLERAVDVVDGGNMGAAVVLGAEDVPGDGEADRIEPDRRHALEIELADEGLVMLAQALGVLGGTQGLLKLRRIGSARRRIQRRGDPRLGDKPTGEVDAAQTL